MKDRAHDESMTELFRADPACAIQVLNDVLDKGDQADLLITLRQIEAAFGDVESMIKAVRPGEPQQKLRAAIAAGLASGPGKPADAVFSRLKTKYRKQGGDL